MEIKINVTSSEEDRKIKDNMNFMEQKRRKDLNTKIEEDKMDILFLKMKRER